MLNCMTLVLKFCPKLYMSTMYRHMFSLTTGRTLEQSDHSLMQTWPSASSLQNLSSTIRKHHSSLPLDTCYQQSRIKDTIISHGCFLREFAIERSIVGVRSRLNSGCELKNTMMMGADLYETEDRSPRWGWIFGSLNKTTYV